MSHFKPISLSDRQIFEEYLGRAGYESSEYTFTNFFIWRRYDNSSWALINDNLCVRAQPAGDEPYFFPPLGQDRIPETIAKCLEIMKTEKQPPQIAHATQKMLDQSPELFQGYKVEEDRDNFDYIYLMEDICQLKGRRFSAQRNHLKNFLKLHKPVVREIAPANFPACHRLLDQWALAKTNPLRSSAENAYLIGSVGAAREIINNWADLKLTGLIVMIGTESAAMSFGEKMTRDMAMTYTEITSPDYKGVSQFINQQFGCRFKSAKYLDREQDLGFPGLRKAKSAYYPDHFIKKYTLTPK